MVKIKSFQNFRKKKSKPSKYKNKPVYFNGNRFHSKKEARRYIKLLDMFGKGEIENLELQPRFKFPPGFSYYADFRYVKNGKVVVEDTKGFRTEEFIIKKKCMEYFYPNIVLTEL